MKILRFNDADFKSEFDKLVRRSDMDMKSVMPIVQGIIDDIKSRGDAALNEQIAKFDKWEVKGNLAITPDEMKKAFDELSAELKNALQVAYDRIFAYHEKQLEKSWISFDETGSLLGQKITPVDRAGLYVPGGNTPFLYCLQQKMEDMT